MIKTILLIALGIFFILNGLNHLFNTHVLTEYVEKRRLPFPEAGVYISGVVLIFGGVTLMTGFLQLYGIIGLCIFIVVASFTIHQFWAETERDARMFEMMQFAKNFAIFIELVYIATA